MVRPITVLQKPLEYQNNFHVYETLNMFYFYPISPYELSQLTSWTHHMLQPHTLQLHNISIHNISITAIPLRLLHWYIPSPVTQHVLSHLKAPFVFRGWSHPHRPNRIGTRNSRIEGISLTHPLFIKHHPTPLWNYWVVWLIGTVNEISSEISSLGPPSGVEGNHGGRELSW